MKPVGTRNFGGLFAESTNTGLQPYMYNGKELDRTYGLDWHDYGARHYDAALLRWHTVDPLCEKYYHMSPYAFCANNFVNAFDPKGDSVAVITNGFHMAMLIQNPQDGQWGYFSINGTNKGWLGFGQPYNNKGEESFSSPEAFIVSQYNKEQPDGDEPVSGYNYDKGYVIGSSKEQDAKMQSAFIDIADNEEYNFFYNNCVTTTQRAMVEGGLNGQPTVAREYEVNLPIRGIVPLVPIIVPIRIPKLSQATPKNVYNYIKHNNFGREINK